MAFAAFLVVCLACAFFVWHGTRSLWKTAYTFASAAGFILVGSGIASLTIGKMMGYNTHEAVQLLMPYAFPIAITILLALLAVLWRHS